MRKIIGAVMFVVLSSGGMFGTGPSLAESDSAKPSQEPVTKRLGISWTLGIFRLNLYCPGDNESKTDLTAAKAVFTRDDQPRLDLTPGKPAMESVLPNGWMIWVEEGGVLYRAGFRTGDVITVIGGKEYQVFDDFAQLLESALQKDGHVLLRIRHFREGYWLNPCNTPSPQGELLPGRGVAAKGNAPPPVLLPSPYEVTSDRPGSEKEGQASFEKEGLFKNWIKVQESTPSDYWYQDRELIVLSVK
jgi:hypothetical protein